MILTPSLQVGMEGRCQLAGNETVPTFLLSRRVTITIWPSNMLKRLEASMNEGRQAEWKQMKRCRRKSCTSSEAISTQEGVQATVRIGYNTDSGLHTNANIVGERVG